jgi:hypothetical protein
VDALPTLIAVLGRLSAAGLIAAVALCGAPVSLFAIELSRADARMINDLLGEGVLGSALPAEPIADPQALLPLAAATWQFRVTSGADLGTTEQSVLKRLPHKTYGARWQYQDGRHYVSYLRETWDGSIVLTAEEDLSLNVLIRYDPPQPVLMRGMRPGEERELMSILKVSDLSDPDTVTHRGSLMVRYSYLGRFNVAVPAGTYAAALIRWKYEGEIGPARIKDTEYRFFADGEGPIAVIDKRHLSAMLMFNDDRKYGKILLNESRQ